jgi:hypothetical protein
MTGKKWYYSFMKRRPNLSLRQPEITSVSRAKSFRKGTANHFFDIRDENRLDATRIYNADES